MTTTAQFDNVSIIKHANIYFDGNREDINRRHIWKSSVKDGNPTAITSGEGIEMFPAFGGINLYCIRSPLTVRECW